MQKGDLSNGVSSKDEQFLKDRWLVLSSVEISAILGKLVELYQQRLFIAFYENPAIFTV